MQIEGMCPGYLSHKDEKRDKRDWDDDEDSDDGATRRCDNERGMKKRKLQGRSNEMKRVSKTTVTL